MIQETALEASRDCKASNLTAGQRRRLSIAVELLSDRRVLLLDQPLVGLVAAEALELMKVLKRLSTKKVKYSAWMCTCTCPLPALSRQTSAYRLVALARKERRKECNHTWPARFTEESRRRKSSKTCRELASRRKRLNVFTPAVDPSFKAILQPHNRKFLSAILKQVLHPLTRPACLLERTHRGGRRPRWREPFP